MQTVISAFEDQTAAQRAMDRLVDAGFARQHIHLQSGYSAATPSDTMASTTTTDHHSRVDDDSDGFMGSVKHFFSGLFGGDSDTSTHSAGTYSEAVRRGSAVLTVDAMSEEEAEQASEIMDECGAMDIDAHSDKWRESGWTPSGAAAGTTGMAATGAAGVAMATNSPNTMNTKNTMNTMDTGTMPTTADDGSTLKVVQEELQVGKRRVDRGGVRVIQRVSEVPVQEMVSLRSEKAVIERRPVDRVATEADFTNAEGGTIEIRETAEEAVVGKTARVVEEVVVGKKVEERTETIRDKIRRKDVEIENVDEHAVAARDTKIDGDLGGRAGLDPTAKRNQ